eukprot:TRINITY_DN67667_c8_g1_i1.p1 TRINITY_DN67667_c8_g1~~TRINITY_DN67667_c8_g1_i1.p1  ORF type:complete len:515 (-),score=27.51 TRINITY_DN67667_c8_g1_i1:509-2026(-)
MSVTTTLCCLLLVTCTLPTVNSSFLGCDTEQIAAGKFSDPQEVCDFAGYGRKVGMLVGPPLIIAILTLICCPIFFCGRCCNCCGGRKQEIGVCCVESNSMKVYSMKEVWLVKGCHVVMLILAVIGLIIGIMGTTSLLDEVDNGFVVVDGVVNDVQGQANEIKTELRNMNREIERIGESLGKEEEFAEMKAPEDQIDTATDAAEDFREKVADARADANRYRDQTTRSGMGFFIFNAIWVAIALIFAMLNTRRIAPYVILIFLFLCGFFAWFTLAIQVSMQIIITDLCEEIDLTLANPDNSALYSVFKCDDPETWQFDVVQQLAEDVESEVASKSCSLPQETNGFCLTFNCPAQQSCTSFEQSDTFIQDLRMKPLTSSLTCDNAQQNLPCNIPDCATHCSVDDLKTTSTAMVDLTDLAKRAVDLLENTILPLLNCKFVFDTLLGPVSPTCHSIKKQTGKLVVGSVLECIALLITTILTILGTKRWISSKDPHIKNNNAVQHKPSESY